MTNTGWQQGKNLDTTKDGYFIEHAGSLWAGDCNKQNTIEEIIAMTKEYHFEPFTYCKKTGDRWYFRGNFREISNVFNVIVWNEKLARKLQRVVRLNKLT